MRIIRLIVVHCSAVRPGQTSSAAQIDMWHRQRGWKLGKALTMVPFNPDAADMKKMAADWDKLIFPPSADE